MAYNMEFSRKFIEVLKSSKNPKAFTSCLFTISTIGLILWIPNPIHVHTCILCISYEIKWARMLFNVLTSIYLIANHLLEMFAYQIEIYSYYFCVLCSLQIIQNSRKTKNVQNIVGTINYYVFKKFSHSISNENSALAKW